MYFKKHATAFETHSPATHFLKFAIAEKSPQEQHRDWLEDISQNIWDRIKFENEMIPSTDALYLHWQRSCWVLHMWRQADDNMMLQPMTNYGWTLSNGKLSVIWEAPHNIEAIRRRVGLLLKGCKCTTGCLTGRCGCRKDNRQCCEGCQCKNCSNLTSATENTELADIAIEEIATYNTEIDEDLDDEMELIFGRQTESNWSDLDEDKSENEDTETLKE